MTSADIRIGREYAVSNGRYSGKRSAQRGVVKGPGPRTGTWMVSTFSPEGTAREPRLVKSRDIFRTWDEYLVLREQWKVESAEATAKRQLISDQHFQIKVRLAAVLGLDKETFDLTKDLDLRFDTNDQPSHLGIGGTSLAALVSRMEK